MRSWIGLAMLVLVPGTAAADPVAVAVGDATGDLAAVSVAGRATSRGFCVPVAGPVTACVASVAVSGTGDAQAGFCFGYASLCAPVAVSGAGAADGFVAASALGPARGDVLAASALGDASTCTHLLDCWSIAASAFGDASCSGIGPFSPFSCAAVTLTGDATCSGGNALLPCFAVSGTGRASGPVAVSLCDVAAAACLDPL